MASSTPHLSHVARLTEGPTPQQWNSHKEDIRALYATKPLKEVRAIMEQRYGFRATDRMYKSRLSTWGVTKALQERQYQMCARLHQIRKQNGKHDSLFRINGNEKSLRDLRKYIKGRKMSEDSFLALAEQNVTDEQLGEQQNVRAVTPLWDRVTRMENPVMGATSASAFVPRHEVSFPRFGTADSGYGTSRTRNSTCDSGYLSSMSHSSISPPSSSRPQTMASFNQPLTPDPSTAPPRVLVNEVPRAATFIPFLGQSFFDRTSSHHRERNIEKANRGEGDFFGMAYFLNSDGEDIENVTKLAEPKMGADRSFIAPSERGEQQGTHTAGQKRLSQSPAKSEPLAHEVHRAVGHTFSPEKKSSSRAFDSFTLCPSPGPSWDGVDIRASTSDGEVSFVGGAEAPIYSPTTPDTPHGVARRVILQLSWEIVQLCPTFPASGLMSHASGSPRADTTSSSSRGHTQSTTATSLRATNQSGKNNTSSERQCANDGNNDSDEDNENSRRQGRANDRARGHTDSGKLLACPYSKHDSNRYSSRNDAEKEYRRCSSSFLKNISRLKQHLYRVHKMPEHYCSRCYGVFDTRDHLDEHSRQATACRISQPKFTEKMTETQFKAIKRRVIRGDPCALWFSIFRTLFPGSPVPNSPYASCVDAAMINHFVAFFRSMGPELMLNLMRDLREQNGELPRLELSTQSIVDEAFEIALPQYLSREQNTIMQNQETGTTSQNDPRQTWPNMMLHDHESGTMSQNDLHQVWATRYIFGMPVYHGHDSQHNTTFATAAAGPSQPPAVPLHGDFTTQPFYNGPFDHHPINLGYEESQDPQGFVIDPADVPIAFDAYASNLDTSSTLVSSQAPEGRRQQP